MDKGRVMGVGHRRGMFATILAASLALVVSIVPVPAASAGTTASISISNREKVVELWRYSGQTVRAAAATALIGSDADVETFLTTTLASTQATDQRIRVDQLLSSGGPSMQTAAQQALDSTASGALQTFLESGWQVPWGSDQRVRVDQILATGEANLQAAAQQALDANSVDALQTFLQSGWQTPFATDQRIRVDQILATGGPEVRTAAQQALDAGTTDADRKSTRLNSSHRP